MWVLVTVSQVGSCGLLPLPYCWATSREQPRNNWKEAFGGARFGEWGLGRETGGSTPEPLDKRGVVACLL